MQEALEALDRAIQGRPIYEDDDAQFEAKYRGASVEAAMESLKLVSERLKTQQSTIIKDRLANGLYEEIIRRPDEPGPRFRGSGKGLSTFGSSKEVLPDGLIRDRTTEIKQGEYPDFDSLRMEKWYLIRLTRGKLATSTSPPHGDDH
jgi:hypothetical protein